MTTIEITAFTPPALRGGSSVRLADAAAGLWRVLDAHGRIIGHLEAHVERQGVRYRACRFHAATRALRELGDFWSADDAVDCLRFAR